MRSSTPLPLVIHSAFYWKIFWRTSSENWTNLEAILKPCPSHYSHCSFETCHIKLKHCVEVDKAIWWVPSLWHSATPPLKNLGYAPVIYHYDYSVVILSSLGHILACTYHPWGHSLTKQKRDAPRTFRRLKKGGFLLGCSASKGPQWELLQYLTCVLSPCHVFAQTVLKDLLFQQWANILIRSVKYISHRHIYFKP